MSEQLLQKPEVFVQKSTKLITRFTEAAASKFLVCSFERF